MYIFHTYIIIYTCVHMHACTFIFISIHTTKDICMSMYNTCTLYNINMYIKMCISSHAAPAKASSYIHMLCNIYIYVYVCIYILT
jgi:hypothetical protein